MLSAPVAMGRKRPRASRCTDCPSSCLQISRQALSGPTCAYQAEHSRLTASIWACSGELAAADPPVYWPERKYTYGTAEAFNTVR